MQELRVNLGDREAAKSAWAQCGFMAFLGVLIPIAAWSDGKPASMVIGLTAFSIVVVGLVSWFQISMAKAQVRNSAFLLVSTVEKVSLLQNGELIWTLPWTEIGSYRLIFPKPWTMVGTSDDLGIELFSLDGKAIGFIPAFQSQSAESAKRAELWRAFISELKIRYPSSLQEHLPTTEFRNATAKSATRKGLLGAILSVPPGWMLRDVLSYWRTGVPSNEWTVWFGHFGRTGLLMIPLFIGLSIGIWGVAALLLKKATLAELKLDTNSVRINDHRLDIHRKGRDICLEEGQQYEYADAEWIRLKLQQIITPAKILIGMAIGMTVLAYLVPSSSPPPPKDFWIMLGIFAAGLIAFCSYSIYVYSDFRSNLHDQFQVAGQLLIVRKPSGEEIIVNLPNSKTFPLAGKGQFSVKAFPTETGKKYRVDPSYLVELG